MGYETTAVFISGYGKKTVGYQKVEATLEMGSIAYGRVEELIQKHTIKDPITLDLINQWSMTHKQCFVEGDYSPYYNSLPGKEQRALISKMFKLEKKLNNLVPHVFISNDHQQDYEDRYGDPLIVVGLEELAEAVKVENARLIAVGSYKVPGYRRFNLLLSMIASFMSDFTPGTIKVVLYGH